jgi:hypothetical protein
MDRSQAYHQIILALLVMILAQNLFPSVAYAAEPSRSIDDSFDLMIAARGILLEDDVDDGGEVAAAPAFYSRRWDVPPDSPAEQILVRLINATKKHLGDLEQACKELRSSFSEGEQDCEEKLSKAFCDEQIAKLRARLSFLRKVRGDRRRRLTKVWHSIKRAGARVWHKIGPIGRRFLRELGKDTLSIVRSGGSLHGGVLRRLVIKHARAVGRRTLRGVMKRTAERAILGQAKIAGDDCGGDQVAQDPEENEPLDCSSDWFEEAWADLEALLIDDGKNCQVSGAILLHDCLLEQAINGACKDDALNTCQSVYDEIPSNDAGGSVTMSGEVLHGGAVANEFSITYPSDGGAVSGNFYYQIYDDVFDCTITVTTSGVMGNYDPKTCSMSGTAYMTVTHEGMTCVSVCGPTENSPAPCPVTIEGPTTWDATLEDSVLSGGVGGRECEPHCFGFRAPK